jgi:DNA-binding MarR family transcriptional regulator
MPQAPETPSGSPAAATAGASAPAAHDGLGLLKLLWSVDHSLQSLSKRMENQLDVTGPQRLVVRLIAQRENISAGEIADELRLHPSTVTGILHRLENRQRIERLGDPADRRRALFRLTEAGRAVDALRAGTIEVVVSRVAAQADPASLAAAQAILRTLVDELDRECQTE